MDKRFDGGMDSERGYLIFKGTQGEIVEQISKVFTGFADDCDDMYKEYAELLLKKLRKYQKLLGDDEILMTYTEDNTDGKKLILEEKCLYINIRQATFLLLFKLLDKVLPLPAGSFIRASDALQMFESKPVMVFLQGIQDELCILMETARCGKKGADKNLLLWGNKSQECINNHYQCEYNQEGKCTCTPEKVKSILEHLCGLGVLKKRFGKYCYVPDFLLNLSED